MLTGDRSHTRQGISSRALITNLLPSNNIEGIAEIVDGLVLTALPYFELSPAIRDLSPFRARGRLCPASVF
jgi:hypothetical protein